MSAKSEQPAWVKLLWAGIVLQSLTYCSGSTDGGGGHGGTSSGGTDTMSYAGHTAGCAKNCGPGCTGYPGCASNSAGTPSSGNGGMPGSGGNSGGIGGSGGYGGYGGFGFAGHTADCLNNCHPGCGFCGGQNGGGTPASGSGGLGGALDGLGGAGAGEGGEASSGAPPAMRRLAATESRACYALTGYEADPCLPPDDSLLQWLNSPNLGCPLTVVGGPTLTSGAIGRACCYSVSCADRSH
jgi:hypothetical protein